MDPKLDPKNAHFCVPVLVEKWTRKLDPKTGPQNWIPKLDPKTGSQNWTPKTRPENGSKKCPQKEA